MGFFKESYEDGYQFNKSNFNTSTVAVLVIACNRPSISRCLNKLLKYRKSKEQFPIIVSQDCIHERTSQVIKSFGSEITHIHQPDQKEIKVPSKEKKFNGYFKIARHYKWALNQVFNTYNYGTAVIVEDDLDVAPDFFEYFKATLPILQKDRTLWCVSAWNDNGKFALIDRNDPKLLYRTDFFPGLGWMLTRELWIELHKKWPNSYWDDWMRHPDQRKGRSCIRPELSRSKTFGKIGVSNGLFYDKHLKFIYLNEVPVDFTKFNLTYLLKNEYDNNFVGHVYKAPQVNYNELKTKAIKHNDPVRITYYTKNNLKSLTKLFGLMDDFKSGVPRTAYKGIISFTYENRRVYLAPSNDWKGYDPTWQ
ncbi:alpha-1,3-mannosyl-glycoprotein 2-beta-N-acetylglucosaminyltransferase [Adelges cooleyi]|uniref:alpha-1,3-mannosyl-glycoprotein 2-beta-N-acetylglucosaminyltransferase n=1 Tax=Adelges cooleyi TaxID=133065 RepID=UPI00217FF39A|nr:alpha-1,3-mannosyl-glycoprotein 2-beta-N-acetylglucosaminyltransferase [Adelges cooleyi]